MRLPNVFTALADICLAGLATGRRCSSAGRRSSCLLPASACLYCGGMVWNDFFDVEQDRRERPFRPLPPGGSPAESAALFGAGAPGPRRRLRFPGGAVARVRLPLGAPASRLALVPAILLYDGWLKRTWAGRSAWGPAAS